MVEKKGILANFVGVRMAQSARMPQPLALTDTLDNISLPAGVYVDSPLVSCGISVLVVRDDNSPPRRSTIGGFVYINDEFYGLTAAHAFGEYTPITNDTGAENDIEFEFYGASDSDDSSDDGSELLGMTSKGRLGMASIDSVCSLYFRKRFVD